MSSIPNVDVSKFLGSSFPPEECTLQRLEVEALKDGTHAKILSDSTFITKMIGYFVENMFERVVDSRSHMIDFWSEAVGNSFFKPHGIDCSGSLQSLQFQKSSPAIPYPIINGSILVGGSRGAIPIEFTPLYYGVPVAHKIENSDIIIDPFYVEPAAFLSMVNKNTVVELCKIAQLLLNDNDYY